MKSRLSVTFISFNPYNSRHSYHNFPYLKDEEAEAQRGYSSQGYIMQHPGENSYLELPSISLYVLFMLQFPPICPKKESITSVYRMPCILNSIKIMSKNYFPSDGVNRRKSCKWI